MNTTTNPTPEQQQDAFTVDFLAWLNENYHQAGTDKYFHKDDKVTADHDITFVNTAYCLAEYREVHIPQLPPLPQPSGTLEQRLLVESKKATDRARGMYNGYVKICALMEVPGPLPKDQLTVIIAEALATNS